MKKKSSVFDDWPEKYDQWFETPIGRLVRKYESKLLLEMLTPGRGERILDAGCGTGVFTSDLLSSEAEVTGLELSLPMLLWAGQKLDGRLFDMVQGNMSHLPFSNDAFDKAVSVTAIGFINDAGGALDELFRVTKPGGLIVVATLNRLSPWAARRTEAAKKGHQIFKHMNFRSPDEIKALKAVPGITKTAIHFQKSDAPDFAKKIEEKGQALGLETGAFLVAQWKKP